MNPELMTALGETATVIVAFIIFFQILKKYAWGPILGLIDERQKVIQDGFDEVRRLTEEAQEQGRVYEEKLKDIEAEARQKIEEAVNDGKRVSAELTEKARADADALVEKTRRNIELEMAAARKQLREEVINLTLMASEKLIGEKLTEDKDKELVGSILGDLEKESL